ncbi:hypothetical protein VB776_09860 [Arcicella sp. DC2W]|uniref:Uncharacterized protein n=1 Tax=Arcicella gelida TaxID=2984195 RepID=A0ABU5S3Z2_9BACT|nr:hypothetical protein [Arcicella sp. DC2W]MEA5403219.1 hypothetical protein [Arcicella sp. DC2W]
MRSRATKREKGSHHTNEEQILLQSAKIASSKAIRTSAALGLTVKIIRDGKIISINPDKSEVVLRTLDKHEVDTSRFKKGMILERK